MKRYVIQLLCGICALVFLGWLGQLQGWGDSSKHLPRAITSLETVNAAYGNWARRQSASSKPNSLVLSLTPGPVSTAGKNGASGTAIVDLVTGTLSITAIGLDPGGYDVWLIENTAGEGTSLRPQPGDWWVRVGALESRDDTWFLSADLHQVIPADFELDLVLVSEAASDPDKHVLYGTPSLFQRMYFAQRAPWPMFAPLEVAGKARPLPQGAWTFLVPRPAFADKPGNVPAKLIEEGARLFFEETFEGNGRTCGTCHPANNNLTLDPEFIATLPDDDPLFVAESNPNLSDNFEKPMLMRKFGLILENADGFDNLDDKFTLRGIPHTLGLATSLTPATDGFDDGTTMPPIDRTGWSGDGAPGDGSLRQFAVGAIIQHFPKTLGRVPGVDFRLPTDAELDAMEAFQLSLGRSSDPDLLNLGFSELAAENGRVLFLNNESRCNICHRDAGANASFADGNFNFNTGVENLGFQGLGKGLKPDDGGFGQEPNLEGSFGDGTFNTPPLVEAADTPPFFHNNVVATLEEAVEFYTGPEFTDSPAGVGFPAIVLTDSEVLEIAAFLRALNAVENIRASTVGLESARSLNSLPEVASMLELVDAEIEDARQVLSEALEGEGINPDAVVLLEEAAQLLEEAAEEPVKRLRRNLIDDALDALEAARDSIVTQFG